MDNETKEIVNQILGEPETGEGLEMALEFKDKKIQEEISTFRRKLLEHVRAIKVFEPDTKAKTYENGFRNGNNSAIELALGHIEKDIEKLEKQLAPIHSPILKDGVSLGIIIKSTKPKIEQLAQDMKTFDKTGQLEALKQYSNQLKAEGVTYTIYDDFKDIYNHTIQTANSLTTYVNTKEAKKYIKEVERFYQKKSNALDYLSELDAIIASGNTDKALVELEINKAYWEEQLNKDPDNLLVFVNSKADDTEYNAFMRLKNRVSPSKFSLQEYQKKYKIDINVFNDELEFIFEAARNISDYQTPVEYRRLLDCEDKMISNYSDINTMLAANKYRVYLSAVIFRGLGKKIQDLRKEIIEEQKRRDQEKTKTLIAEAKTKEAEGKLKTINDQIKEAETEREQLREMSNNIIKMHTSITKSQPELKVDESGDATSPDNEPKQLTDVESKIKTTPADPKLISKKQTEGFIYIRRLNKFVRIKLAKSRFKNQKPKHAILDSIGRLSGTMTDEEFQAEYAKWKVAEDDKKRGGTSDKKRAD